METKAGSYEVPLGVSSIGEKAFKECDDLTDIKISGNVARIGKEAFSQCSELRSISIPASVQYIDDAAFIWCGNLSSITILNKDCRIAEEALDNFDKDVEGVTWQLFMDIKVLRLRHMRKNMGINLSHWTETAAGMNRKFQLSSRRRISPSFRQ